jgi:hypothetical protein
LQPPNIEKLLNITKKCRELFARMNNYYLPPNFKYPNGTSEDSLEPKIINLVIIIKKYFKLLYNILTN